MPVSELTSVTRGMKSGAQPWMGWGSHAACDPLLLPSACKYRNAVRLSGSALAQGARLPVKHCYYQQAHAREGQG